MYLNARPHTCLRENFILIKPTVFDINLDDGTVTISGAESPLWTGAIIQNLQAIILTLYDSSDVIPYLTTPLIFNVNYSTTSPVGYHIKVRPFGDSLANLTQIITINENSIATDITNHSMGSFNEPFLLVRNATTWIIP